MKFHISDHILIIPVGGANKIQNRIPPPLRAWSVQPRANKMCPQGRILWGPLKRWVGTCQITDTVAQLSLLVN